MPDDNIKHLIGLSLNGLCLSNLFTEGRRSQSDDNSNTNHTWAVSSWICSLMLVYMHTSFKLRLIIIIATFRALMHGRKEMQNFKLNVVPTCNLGSYIFSSPSVCCTLKFLSAATSKLYAWIWLLVFTFHLPDLTSSLTRPLSWICLTSIRYINTHQ